MTLVALFTVLETGHIDKSFTSYYCLILMDNESHHPPILFLHLPHHYCHPFLSSSHQPLVDSAGLSSLPNMVSVVRVNGKIPKEESTSPTMYSTSAPLPDQVFLFEMVRKVNLSVVGNVSGVFVRDFLDLRGGGGGRGAFG